MANKVNISNTDNIVTVTQETTQIVTVASQGPQGPAGPAGLQGPPGDTIDTGSLVTTSSFNTFTSSIQTEVNSLTAATSSYILISQTGSFATTGSNIFVGDQIITGSVIITGSSTLTNIGPAIFSGSLEVTEGITGSLLGTASFATNALSASFAISASHEIIKEVSSSFADTASFGLNNFDTISYNNTTFNITGIRSNGGQQTATITNVPSASHANTASLAGNLYGTPSIVVNDITASGNISASGDITTSALTASGLNYPSADGIDGSVIVSDGLGNLSMGHGERLVVQVRNNESFTITAGTPLHAIGSIGGSQRVLVVTASADSSHSDTMPAFGIAATDLTPTGDTKDGFAVTTGIFPDYNITLASGSITVEEGQILYVGQNGGLTNVKPDTNDQNLIQNVGIVLKTNGTLVQNLQVSAINRTNDVPNLNQGNIFFGSGSNYAKIHISGALDQTIINNITASGNISASGDIVANNLSGTNTGDQDLSNLVTNAQTASFAITGSDVIFGNITSSGNISASGDIRGNTLRVGVTGDNTTGLFISASSFNGDPRDVQIIYPNHGLHFNSNSPDNHVLTLAGNSVGVRAEADEIAGGSALKVSGSITIVDGHITASGNVSASGDIIANNITANGAITASAVGNPGQIIRLGGATNFIDVEDGGDSTIDFIGGETNFKYSTLFFKDAQDGATIYLQGSNGSDNVRMQFGDPEFESTGFQLDLNIGNQSAHFSGLNITASNNISASGQIIGDVVDTSFENFLNFEAALTSYTYIAPFPLTINFTGSSTSSMEVVDFVTASANTTNFSIRQNPPITLNRFDKLRITPSSSGLFTFSGSRII